MCETDNISSWAVSDIKIVVTTDVPTVAPTGLTDVPSDAPTNSPTGAPTAPTDAPTDAPTYSPVTPLTLDANMTVNNGTWTDDCAADLKYFYGSGYYDRVLSDEGSETCVHGPWGAEQNGRYFGMRIATDFAWASVSFQARFHLMCRANINDSIAVYANNVLTWVCYVLHYNMCLQHL